MLQNKTENNAIFQCVLTEYRLNGVREASDPYWRWSVWLGADLLKSV